MTGICLDSQLQPLLTGSRQTSLKKLTLHLWSQAFSDKNPNPRCEVQMPFSFLTHFPMLESQVQINRVHSRGEQSKASEGVGRQGLLFSSEYQAGQNLEFSGNALFGIKKVILFECFELISNGNTNVASTGSTVYTNSERLKKYYVP